jgi:Fuc2NAc and GlcNAc transferase
MNTVGFLAAGALVASLLLTWCARSLALRLRVLDTPNSRSSHSAPTPRGGGIAVLVGSALTAALGDRLGVIDTRYFATLTAGMAVLGLVGWMDDRRGVHPIARLMVQVAVAAATLYVLGGLPAVRFGSAALQLGAVGAVLGVIGVVWSINLFNFMDGIDGLAGSQAVLIFGSAALLLLLHGAVSLGALAAILAAAALGFLAWNWPPAKIFLGDVGSGPIGYAVATLAIASENSGGIPLVAFALIGGVFICDSTITLVRRLMRGHGAWEAHREHAYQRLSRAWGGHLPVTLAAAATTVVLGGLALAGTVYPALLPGALAVGALLLLALVVASERFAPL